MPFGYVKYNIAGAVAIVYFANPVESGSLRA